MKDRPPTPMTPTTAPFPLKVSLSRSMTFVSSCPPSTRKKSLHTQVMKSAVSSSHPDDPQLMSIIRKRLGEYESWLLSQRGLTDRHCGEISQQVNFFSATVEHDTINSVLDRDSMVCQWKKNQKLLTPQTIKNYLYSSRFIMYVEANSWSMADAPSRRNREK